MHRITVLLAGAALLLALPSQAAIVGHSEPPPSLSAERIATLPAEQQAAWKSYLTKSEAQLQADKAALAAERARLTGPAPASPAEHTHDHSMPLHKNAAWYGETDARHIADVIVSFQTPAGGWGKNADRSGPVRLPGQDFVGNNVSAHLTPGDFDTPRDLHWDYVGTLDNNATTTELHFLARVSAALPGKDGEVYRASFIKGVQYILNAQFPNGGWPQIWPLQGGYHDAVTYNDDAVSEAATLLKDVADNAQGTFAFVPADMRQAAKRAADKALDVILKTQITVNGVPTVWGQQHDCLTLAPVAARNFEPALPSTDESASLLVYLMSLPDPSPALVRSIHGAGRWLQQAALYGYEWTEPGSDGRHLVAKAGAGPLWSRYYTIDFKPRFGDRDKSIHDDVNEISKERRNGYSWFNQGPAKALKIYTKWSKVHPLP